MFPSIGTATANLLKASTATIHPLYWSFAKTGGVLHVTCSAPPGLHSELLLRLPFLYLTVSILSPSVVSVGFCCVSWVLL